MNKSLLFYQILGFCLLIGLSVGQDRSLCQYVVSPNCSYWNSTCFQTIDQALTKIKSLSCDQFDLVLENSSSPYSLGFSGQAFSPNLQYLRIMSQELDYPQTVIINDANIQINTQNLFIINIIFVLNRTLKYQSVFELKSDSLSDPICSLSEVKLTGANNLTFGNFIKSSGYKIVLQDVEISRNKLFVSELGHSFFEFFYITYNSTFREDSNNSVATYGLSFIENTYRFLSTQQEYDFLKAAAIEMGSTDINETISTLMKQAEDRFLLFRLENLIQFTMEETEISFNTIYTNLIKVTSLVASMSLNVVLTDFTAEMNIITSGNMISIFGNLEDIIIKGLNFNSNLMFDHSNFLSMPSNFNNYFNLTDVVMTSNMLTLSSIIAPLYGIITPIFQLDSYAISIANFTFTQNTFDNISNILYVKSFDSGIQLDNWTFVDNTFRRDSNPVTLVQVPELKVANSLFQGNYLEDVIFRVSIALQVFFIDNMFLEFVPPSFQLLSGYYWTGGILEGEICQGAVFTNNTVQYFFSLNYKAFSIIDYRCNLAFNETRSNDSGITREKFTFKNNSFKNCFIFGYNDFNSLISILLHEKEYMIEFYDNIFNENVLESDVSFVRSATNIIIYSTMSTVVISNCSFTSNQANNQMPNVGIFAQSLTIFKSNFENNGLSVMLGFFRNYTNLATTGGALAAAVNNLNITLCMFSGNQAERGAALYLERSNLKLISPSHISNGSLIIINSTFVNNSASYGGAIYFDSSQANQTLGVTKAVFLRNTAVFAGGAFYFDREVSSKLSWVIGTSEFEENTAVQGAAIFYLSTSSLQIVNCTFHYTKSNLLTFKHSNATVLIMFSRFLGNSQQEGESGNELINVDGYFSTKLRVKMTNCSFTDIPSPGNKFSSVLQVRGNDAKVADLYSNYTNIKFGKCGIMQIREAGKLTINGSFFYNLSGKYISGDDPFRTDSRLTVEEDSAAIIVRTLGRLTVDRSSFTKVNGSLILVLNTGTQIQLYNSNFSRIRGIDGAVVDFHGDIWVPRYSKTQIIHNCKFSNCSAETMGGAIIGQAMAYEIYNSTFSDCTAKTGGAVRILSNSQASIANSLFRRNTADYGAAISYNPSTTPNFTNLRFDRNVAKIYGDNKASFATNIVLKFDNETYHEYNFTNQTIRQSLKVYGTNYTSFEFHLIDDENQTVKDDNLTLVSLHIETPEKESHQLLLERAVSGVVTVDFQSIVLYGSPGNTSVLYVTHKTTNKVVKISISFRDCELGEIFEEKTKSCFRCGSGTYTIRINDNKCRSCPNNAICYGGYNFDVQPGYWRASVNSTNIISCGERKEYCEGGRESKCANNTGGVLCESCNSSATPPIVKDALNQCRVCSDSKSSYGVRVSLILISVILLGMLLFYFILKSNYSYTREGTNFNSLTRNKRSKNFGVFLRITLMYSQLMMLLTHFDGGIPKILAPLYNVFGDPIVIILFWSRCWIASVSSKLDQVFFEYLITVFLPLITLVVLILYTGLVRKGYFPRSKRPEYFSALVLVFTWLQPQLLMRHFSMVFCTEIPDGVWYLRQYVDIKCEGPNFVLRQTITIFGIVSWGILIPSYLLVKLHKERNNLKDSQVHVKLGFLYHGYHPKYYYWYFITHTLKTVMVLVTPLWVRASPNQGITLMLICLIYLIVLTRVRPYNDSYANDVEIDVLLVYISLIFFITKYVASEADSWIRICWLILGFLAIAYSLIKILGGIFLSVKETMDPILNWMSRILCFWSQRNRKMRRAEKKEKKDKKNSKIQADPDEKERTRTERREQIVTPMTRSRIKSTVPASEKDETSFSPQGALKQRLLPSVL